MAYLEFDHARKLKKGRTENLIIEKMQRDESTGTRGRLVLEEKKWREEEKRENEEASHLFKSPKEVDPTAANPPNWSAAQIIDYSNSKGGDLDKCHFPSMVSKLRDISQ